MPKLIVKVDEYIQVNRIRNIEVELSEEQAKKYLHGRESMIFDLDNEGEGEFINLIASKVDEKACKELDLIRVEEGPLLCIMKLRVTNV